MHDRTPIPAAMGAAGFRLRLLVPADAQAYLALRLGALRERPPAFGAVPEDEPDVAGAALRLAATDDRRFFGAFCDDALVGVVRLSRYAAANEKHRAYLAGLYVAPEHRGRGCGRALVEQALAQARRDPRLRRVNLTVVAQQTAARRLYRSLGFQAYGVEREAFSCDGRFYDEHLLTLPLVPSDEGPPAPPSEGAGRAETAVEVFEVFRGDQTISAIKYLRALRGLGLKEAKEMIEEVCFHHRTFTLGFENETDAAEFVAAMTEFGFRCRPAAGT